MLCIYCVHNELCYYLHGHDQQRISGLSIEEGIPCTLGTSREVIRTIHQKEVVSCRLRLFHLSLWGPAFPVRLGLRRDGWSCVRLRLRAGSKHWKLTLARAWRFLHMGM